MQYENWIESGKILIKFHTVHWFSITLFTKTTARSLSLIPPMKLNTSSFLLIVIFVNAFCVCATLHSQHKKNEHFGIHASPTLRTLRLFTIKFIHLIAISFCIISLFAAVTVFNWHCARCRQQIDPSFSTLFDVDECIHWKWMVNLQQQKRRQATANGCYKTFQFFSSVNNEN